MKSQTTRFYISAEHLFFYVKTCRFHLLLTENLSLSGEPDVPFRKIKKAFYLLIRQSGLLFTLITHGNPFLSDTHFLYCDYRALIIFKVYIPPKIVQTMLRRAGRTKTPANQSSCLHFSPARNLFPIACLPPPLFLPELLLCHHKVQHYKIFR